MPHECKWFIKAILLPPLRYFRYAWLSVDVFISIDFIIWSKVGVPNRGITFWQHEYLLEGIPADGNCRHI